MKTMFRLSFSLAAYAVVACVALAFVYNTTDPLIQAGARKEVTDALSALYPEAVSFEDVTAKVQSGDPKITFDGVYVAQSEAGVAGIVVKATGPTYGIATLMVGIDPDRSIRTVKVLSITDTPGLGTKAAEEPFRGQFDSKSADSAFTVGKAGSGAEIAAISGATITSKGFARIVALSGSRASEYLSQTNGSAQ